MFYYIEGAVSVIERQLAVLDAGGVGYALRATAITLSKLSVGTRARLYTYLHVREDAVELYGFYSQSEKNCFEMLLGVSGIGPRAALAMLSTVTPEQLAMAVITGNEKALTAAPGIGKKIAQRVILELRDKLGKQEDSAAGLTPAAGWEPGAGTKEKDAAAALSVLGYSREEIARALRNVDTESLSLEDIIRGALKQMIK